MANTKTTFFGQSCGAQSAKLLGKCTSCNEWNTFVEEIVSKDSRDNTQGIVPSTTTQRSAKPRKIADIGVLEQMRVELRDKELQRVLGGGIVPGSLVLF